MKTIKTLLLVLLPIISFCQTSDIENAIYNEINNYKKKQNNSLVLNQELSSVSRKHSIHMEKTNELEHDYSIYEEEIVQRTNNVNRTNSDVAKVVLNNFLNSPSHKEIIENKHHKIGVGVVIDNLGYVWVTIRFS